MNTLGKFPENALQGATGRIKNSVSIAREKIEQLVKIPNKTYMNFARPLMDIGVSIDEQTNPVMHLDRVNNSADTQKIVKEVLPVLSAYAADMSRHFGIYSGFLEIKKNEYENLSDAQKMVVDNAIERAELLGINLPKEDKAKLKQIELRLSDLSNDYENNVIASNQKFKIKISDEKLLGEMPENDKTSAKTKDGWEFCLLQPYYISFMKYVTDSNLREQMYHAQMTRAPENEPIVVEILQLRDDMAKILGFDNFAQLAIKPRSAPNPQVVEKFLDNLGTAVYPCALREFSELKARATKDGKELQPWDKDFYSRILEKEKYNVSEAETKSYFELNQTVNGLFDILNEMFDIEFIRKDVPLWHNCAKYYDVKQNGEIISGLYLDLQTRKSKSSGAWMDEYKFHYVDTNENTHLGEVFVVANLPVATKENPSLLSIKQVETLFHEMGHAIHALLSKVPESDVSGTSVDRDVVEFPSQFLEAFFTTPIVLKRLGKHYQTGESIPDDLINKIIKAKYYGKGIALTRQLEFGMFDLSVHQSHDLDMAGVQKIYQNASKKVAVVPVPDYVRQQNFFTHLFAGGYAAGYYSYLWAEVMSADAFIAFNKNPFDKKLSKRYADIILARGGSKKMNELYREFIGRDPNPESLLQMYGLK